MDREDRLYLAEKLLDRTMESLGRQFGLTESYDGWGSFDTYSPGDQWGSQERYAYLPPVNRRAIGRGEKIPIYLSDQQLRVIRDQSRILAATNEWAICATGNRKNYTVGENGLTVRAVARKGYSPSKDLLRRVQFVVDACTGHNALGEFQREMVERMDRDGEVFVRCFPQPDGILQFRTVEPEWVRSPYGDTDVENSFGVKTKGRDVESPLGYWVTEEPETNEFPELVQAKEVLHLKACVDRNSKRGVPIWYAVGGTLMRAENLLRGICTMADVRARFAVIRRLKGVSKSVAEQFLATLSDGETSDPSGTSSSPREANIERVPMGTVMTANDQIDYEFPAANVAAGELVEVLNAVLRAVAARLRMPEWMLTTDTGSTNYASALVSEAPSVKEFESLQRVFKDAIAESRWPNHRQALLWRQIAYAVELGVLPAEVFESVDLQADAPSLVVRDKSSEATTNKTYLELGIKSPQTICSEQGLDFDQEVENLKKAQEAGWAPPGGGGQGGAPGEAPEGPGGQGGGPELADLLQPDQGEDRPAGVTESAGKEEEADDDLGERARLIAEFLFHLYGEDAVNHLAELEESVGRIELANGLILLEGWNAADHPRGKGGRFIPRGSAEAVSTAKEAVDSVLKGKGGDAKQVADHLAILTVKQLRDLHKANGVPKIPSQIVRQQLVDAVLEKITPAGKGEEKPAEKAPEKAAAKSLHEMAHGGDLEAANKAADSMSLPELKDYAKEHLIPGKTRKEILENLKGQLKQITPEARAENEKQAKANSNLLAARHALETAKSGQTPVDSVADAMNKFGLTYQQYRDEKNAGSERLEAHAKEFAMKDLESKIAGLDLNDPKHADMAQQAKELIAQHNAGNNQESPIDPEHQSEIDRLREFDAKNKTGGRYEAEGWLKLRNKNPGATLPDLSKGAAEWVADDYDADGKAIPPEVLANHPDLQAKYGKKPAEKAVDKVDKPVDKPIGPEKLKDALGHIAGQYENNEDLLGTMVDDLYRNGEELGLSQQEQFRMNEAYLAVSYGIKTGRMPAETGIRWKRMGLQDKIKFLSELASTETEDGARGISNVYSLAKDLLSKKQDKPKEKTNAPAKKPHEMNIDEYMRKEGIEGLEAGIISRKPHVEKALKSGKPVPPEVLADYPDLQAKYGQKPAEKPPAPTPSAEALPAITLDMDADDYTHEHPKVKAAYAALEKAVRSGKGRAQAQEAYEQAAEAARAEFGQRRQAGDIGPIAAPAAPAPTPTAATAPANAADAAKKYGGGLDGDYAAFQDKTKPLSERLDRLSNIDTNTLDNLERGGHLGPAGGHGLGMHNEILRGLRKSYDRFAETGDQSQLAEDIERGKAQIAQTSAGLRKAADAGVSVQDYSGKELGPDRLRAAADFYDQAGAEAIAVIQAETGAKAAPVAAPAAPVASPAQASGGMRSVPAKNPTTQARDIASLAEESNRPVSNVEGLQAVFGDKAGDVLAHLAEQGKISTFGDAKIEQLRARGAAHIEVGGGVVTGFSPTDKLTAADFEEAAKAVGADIPAMSAGQSPAAPAAPAPAATPAASEPTGRLLKSGHYESKWSAHEMTKEEYQNHKTKSPGKTLTVDPKRGIIDHAGGKRTIQVPSRGGKPWLAKLGGKDKKYGREREFMSPSKVERSGMNKQIVHYSYSDLEPGEYEVAGDEFGKYRHTFKVIDPAEHHRQSVEDALVNGSPVHPDVLADYPDLAKKYGKAPVAAPAPAPAATPRPTAQLEKVGERAGSPVYRSPLTRAARTYKYPGVGTIEKVQKDAGHPVSMVNPADLHSAQDYVMGESLDKIEGDIRNPITVVRHKGKLHVEEGNHRAAKAMLTGKQVPAKIVDLADDGKTVVPAR